MSFAASGLAVSSRGTVATSACSTLGCRHPRQPGRERCAECLRDPPARKIRDGAGRAIPPTVHEIFAAIECCSGFARERLCVGRPSTNEQAAAKKAAMVLLHREGCLSFSRVSELIYGRTGQPTQTARIIRNAFLGSRSAPLTKAFYRRAKGLL